MRICVFGLGEAGTLFAGDLVEAGQDVAAFDPAGVVTPGGVERFPHPSLAVRHAELVLGMTSQADAKLAFLQALDAVDRTALYADLSTSAPDLKAELSTLARRRNIDFVDVAMMDAVPGVGVTVPSLASGTGADRYVEIFEQFGGSARMIRGPAGTAAARKLTRSIMMKGVAAVLVEAIWAGAGSDDLEWLWGDATAELTGADEDWIRRLVVGSKVHARRRVDEMESARQMLESMGAPSTMTAATAEVLRTLLTENLPPLPRRDGGGIPTIETAPSVNPEPDDPEQLSLSGGSPPRPPKAVAPPSRATVRSDPSEPPPRPGRRPVPAPGAGREVDTGPAVSDTDPEPGSDIDLGGFEVDDDFDPELTVDDALLQRLTAMLDEEERALEEDEEPEVDGPLGPPVGPEVGDDGAVVISFRPRSPADAGDRLADPGGGDAFPDGDIGDGLGPFGTGTLGEDVVGRARGDRETGEGHRAESDRVEDEADRGEGE